MFHPDVFLLWDLSQDPFLWTPRTHPREGEYRLVLSPLSSSPTRSPWSFDGILLDPSLVASPLHFIYHDLSHLKMFSKIFRLFWNHELKLVDSNTHSLEEYANLCSDVDKEVNSELES